MPGPIVQRIRFGLCPWDFIFPVREAELYTSNSNGM